MPSFPSPCYNIIMDNIDYLNQISAQKTSTASTASSDRLLSPGIIKLLIGAGIALVAIIIIGIALNSSGGKTNNLYQTFYLRVQNLSASSGPIATYSKNLKSSDLRAISGTLRTSLDATYSSLNSILGELRIDPEELNQSVVTSEASHLETYATDLQNAKLNGLLDRTYASSTTLQISLLLSLESEIYEKTSSAALQEIIEQSYSDLAILHDRFTELSNTSK